MGVEFHGSTTISFGSLEILKFEEMLNWEGWDCQTVSRAFPCLKELHIRNCPKLKDKLPEQLPSLEILVIQECQELATLVPWAPTIQSLTLRKCGNLQLEYIPSTLKNLSFHGPCTNATLLEKIEHIIANTCIEVMDIGECLNLEFSWQQRHDSLHDIQVKRSCGSLRNLALDLFPALKRLGLEGCDNLEMISVSEGGMHDPTSLLHLEIVECPKIVSFWEGGFSAPKLRQCCLQHLGNLKSLPECMNIFALSLSSLEISDCPEMESLPKGGLPSKLWYLHINKCPKVIAGRMEWALHNHASLSQLKISDDVVESLPEPQLLPPSLTILFISKCSNLRMLDYKGLCQLSSLQALFLEDCPRLQCLPKEGLPSSLSTLYIWGDCPLLKERCQKLKGQDWSKIAHIPDVWIDGVRQT